jgi:hypothetical protein
MRQADGSRVDAVRNLDKGSLNPQIPGRNPGRSFIGYASGDGFATAGDLVRFAEALGDGTVLDRPFAELFAGAKRPGPEPTSFEAYTMPVGIINGQWVIGRGGATGGSVANWNIYPTPVGSASSSATTTACRYRKSASGRVRPSPAGQSTHQAAADAWPRLADTKRRDLLTFSWVVHARSGSGGHAPPRTLDGRWSPARPAPRQRRRR